MSGIDFFPDDRPFNPNEYEERTPAKQEGSMATIRVDDMVKAELRRRRLPHETNNDGAIRRALLELSLEDRLRRGGLSTTDMANLADLRALRGAS